MSAFLVLDGAPTGTPVAAGEVDADGSFELPLPAGNDYALCAHGSGRPGTLVAHVGFAPSQPLPPVFLPPEMVIEGSLGLRQSWERATVTAELVGASGLFVVGGGELTWLDGSFEWRARVGALEPDGQFRISGLAPALYDLGVSGVQTRERAAVGRLPSLAVRAPAGGVDLAPRMARVRLRRERDGGPVASSSISLVQDFGQGGSSHLTAATDAHGVAEFWLDPDAPAWVQGRESARFVPRELDARAPHPVPDADRPASTGWGWSGE